jgi:transcriptional regulator with XRE-family HTH domain
MDDQALGWAIRSLRHARGWRQADLAVRAGVSASTVRLVEKGQAGRLTIRSVRVVADALGMHLRWDPGPAVQLARLRDTDHATSAEAAAGRLIRAGWRCLPEVSFSRYGERGRIDLLAHLPSRGLVLVVEVKSVVVDVQALLGSLDAKVRLAAGIGRDRGWTVRHVIPGLVLVDGRTNRRRVAEHPTLFARFDVRGRAAESWIEAPKAVPSGLMFWIALPNRNSSDRRQAGRQRIRLKGVATGRA